MCSNGIYLTGGVYLCPTATYKNPGDKPDWIAFEYVGMPPGKMRVSRLPETTEEGFDLFSSRDDRTNSVLAER